MRGAVWWMFTRWRQVWCVCSVKAVWSTPGRFRSDAFHWRRYTNVIPFYLLHTSVKPVSFMCSLIQPISVLVFLHRLFVSTGGNAKNFILNFIEICLFDLDEILKIDGPRGLRDFVRFSRLRNSPNSPKWVGLKMGKSQITREWRENFKLWLYMF